MYVLKVCLCVCMESGGENEAMIMWQVTFWKQEIEFSIITLASITPCKSSWLPLNKKSLVLCPRLDPIDHNTDICRLLERIHIIAIVSVQRQEQDPRQKKKC